MYYVIGFILNGVYGINNFLFIIWISEVKLSLYIFIFFDIFVFIKKRDLILK